MAVQKPAQREIIKIIQDLGYKHGNWQIFTDFIAMSAISISNTVDWVHRDDREKQYLEIVSKYDAKELNKLVHCFALLIEEMQVSAEARHPDDLLGQMFHELELHNKYKGQFFTPGHICDFMGNISLQDHNPAIAEKGYITVCEPCVGSGAMVLGLAKAMSDSGYNYCSQMVVTATDVDLKCVHMAYLQFSLYGIPAVVIHGNSLSLQEWSRWYTPVYMLDGWLWQERCGNVDKKYPDDEALKRATDPIYAAVRGIEKIKSVNAEEAPPATPAQPEIVAIPPMFDITYAENKIGQFTLF